MDLTDGMPTRSAGQGKAELTNPFSQCPARPQISTALTTSSPWKVSTASKHHPKETYLPSHLSGSKRNDFCCFKVKRGITFVLAIIIRSISWEKRYLERTLPYNNAKQCGRFHVSNIMYMEKWTLSSKCYMYLLLGTFPEGKLWTF